MKIAVCDDDRTTREQIASLIREQELDVEVITFETGEDMIKSQESLGAFLKKCISTARRCYCGSCRI